MWKSAGSAPSLRVLTLAFALQLRRKHGITSVRVRKTSVRLRKPSVREKNLSQIFVKTTNCAIPQRHCGVKVKVKQSLYRPVTGPDGFQEVETPRLRDSRHMKMVQLSALHTDRLNPQGNTRYSFLLAAESTPGPQCSRKDDTIGHLTRDLLWRSASTNCATACLRLCGVLTN